MREAIVIKFLPATTTKPARFVARCGVRRHVFNLDSFVGVGISVEESYIKAAEILADRLGLEGLLVGANLSGVGKVFALYEEPDTECADCGCHMRVPCDHIG